MVTGKIKHLQNIFRNVLEPSTSRGYDVDVKIFYFTRNHGPSVAAEWYYCPVGSDDKYANY